MRKRQSPAPLSIRNHPASWTGPRLCCPPLSRSLHNDPPYRETIAVHVHMPRNAHSRTAIVHRSPPTSANCLSSIILSP
jgi:hypothetical protein